MVMKANASCKKATNILICFCIPIINLRNVPIQAKVRSTTHVSVAIPESVILSIDVFIVFAIRHEEIHPFLPHTVSGKLAVVALISDHSRGVGAWSSRSFLWDSDVCHDFVKEPDLSRRGRVGMASQGNTLAIDHHQVLRPFAPFGFPDCRAPFFAGTNVASTNASSQLRMPCSSSSERKARHMSLRYSCLSPNPSSVANRLKDRGIWPANPSTWRRS